MYNKNAAYDLSLFDQKSKKNNLVKINVRKIRKIRAFKAKMALISGGALVFGTVAVGMAMFISGQAVITELTEESTRLTSQIQENENIYNQLNMRKKTEIYKDRLKAQAENELGMIKTENLEYINVADSNKAEIKENFFKITTLKDKIFGVCNNLFGI